VVDSSDTEEIIDSEEDENDEEEESSDETSEAEEELVLEDLGSELSEEAYDYSDSDK
jgi:hypothetical protein